MLRKNLDLRKRYIECFDVADEPYDIVLDDYERGMKTAEVRRLFDDVKEHQAPLVKEVAAVAERARAGRPQTSRSRTRSVFELEVARAFGFDDDALAARPDRAPVRVGHRHHRHPHHHALLPGQPRRSLRGRCTSSGTASTSARSTPRSSARPLARGVSLGMHESQSRMWENLVGRSLPFWRHFFPRLQATFPGAFGGYDAERWYREVNTVEPSLIRVEADEATYNLHIILRFELEQAMLADEFPLEQLPEEWNRRMWDYLGIEVPSDTEGVLQDVHWSGGSIGYFPTYALGNLISAQIWEKITADLPDLDGDFERGEFGTLRDWLRENLHRHGRKFTPGETLERVVGTREIDPEPYVRYLREKLAGIYGIAATAAS